MRRLKNLLKDQNCTSFGAATIILGGAGLRKRRIHLSAKRPFPAIASFPLTLNFRADLWKGTESHLLLQKVSFYRKNPILCKFSMEEGAQLLSLERRIWKRPYFLHR